jgi:hypothetical protein
MVSKSLFCKEWIDSVSKSFEAIPLTNVYFALLTFIFLGESAQGGETEVVG